MARRHAEIVEDVGDALELSKEECATRTLKGDAKTEKLGDGAKIFDVKAIGECRLEGDDEGDEAANKDAVIDVDVKIAKETRTRLTAE